MRFGCGIMRRLFRLCACNGARTSIIVSGKDAIAVIPATLLAELHGRIGLVLVCGREDVILQGAHFFLQA